MSENSPKDLSNEPIQIEKLTSQRLNPRFFSSQASKPCSLDQIFPISNEDFSMNSSLKETHENQPFQKNSSILDNFHANKRKSFSIIVTKTEKNSNNKPEENPLNLLEIPPIYQHKVSQPILMKQKARNHLILFILSNVFLH